MRLDDESPAVARATPDDVTIIMDDRHITPAGARALQSLLNALPLTLADVKPGERSAGEGDSG